jgi:hypothetical protein
MGYVVSDLYEKVVSIKNEVDTIKDNNMAHINEYIKN